MGWWGWAMRRMRVVFRKQDEERELDDEIRFHLRMEARELESIGIGPEEAQRQARLAFGGIERFKERVRDARGGRLLDDLIQDTRLALRSLPKQPAFLLAVLLTLGIGIGGNVAMLSVLNTSLFQALPYPEPEALVLARVTYDGEVGNTVSGPDFFDYREQTSMLAELAAFTPFSLMATATGAEAPQRVRAPLVSTNLFRTLGVAPVLGRGFAEAEGEPGAEAVVILAHGYWQRRFGSDASVVGSILNVDGTPHTVVGVMPAGFRFYMDADLWRPIGRGGSFAQARQFHNFVLVGRVAPGMGLEGAQAEVDGISGRLAELYPDSNRGKGLNLSPLREALTEDYRTPLTLLAGALVLILVVACANVAGLLLARGGARRGEMAVRQAMGAGRRRLIRQLLTENALLAGGSAILGVFLALWLRQGILRFVALDRLGQVDPSSSLPLVGAAAGLALLTLALFGTAPALRISRSTPADDLRSGARTTEGRHTLRTRNGLVVGQVAITVVLLVSAGLLFRSFGELLDVDPGFDARDLLTAEVQLPPGQYQETALRSQFFAQLQDRIGSVPGVQAVGLASHLPVRDQGGNVRVAPPEEWGGAGVFGRLAYQRMVLPGYFAAMGIPLLAGRDVTLADDRNSTRVIILSESLAEDLFPGQDPLGRSLGVDVGNDDPWLVEVVGVVGDVTPSSLAEGVDHAMYFGYVQRSPASMRLAIRTRGASSTLVPALREILRELSPDVPLSGVATMDEVLSASVANRRAIMSLLAAFSLVALLLSAVGLYGLLAYQVSRRTREIGLRLALGASSGDVASRTVRGGLILVALGVLVGAPVAYGAGRGIQGMLYGVGTADPLTYLAVILFLAAVGTLACLLPARRAARVEPMEAFRTE